MVKTVKGSLTLDELNALLYRHIQGLPKYERVVSDTFEAVFNEESTAIFVCRRAEQVCWYCKGSGTRDNEQCWVCKGTGKTLEKKGVKARFRQKDDEMKIEVDTQGTNPEVWKPDVEKIQDFVEGLVGRNCITVPSRATKIKAIDISDMVNQARLFSPPQPTPEPPPEPPRQIQVSEEALQLAKEMEKQFTGQVHDEVRQSGIAVTLPNSQEIKVKLGELFCLKCGFYGLSHEEMEAHKRTHIPKAEEPKARGEEDNMKLPSIIKLEVLAKPEEPKKEIEETEEPEEAEEQQCPYGVTQDKAGDASECDGCEFSNTEGVVSCGWSPEEEQERFTEETNQILDEPKAKQKGLADFF